MTTANPGLSEEFVSPFGCFAPSTLVATESLRLARPPASTPDHQRVPRSDVDAFRFFLSREIECPRLNGARNNTNTNTNTAANSTASLAVACVPHIPFFPTPDRRHLVPIEYYKLKYHTL